MKTGRDTIRTTSLKRQLQEFFERDLDATVNWFREQMADYYFLATPASEQIRHLEVLHAMRRMRETRSTMVDDTESGKVLFFGRPSPALLRESLAMLGDRPFHRLELHTTRDRSLCICAFVHSEPAIDESSDLDALRQRVLEATCSGGACLARHVVDRYLASVDNGYLSRSYPDRVARHVRAWATLTDPEGIHVQADAHTEHGLVVTRILIAGRLSRSVFVHNLAEFLVSHDLFLQRGYLDTVPSYSGSGHTLISTVYVTDADGQPLDEPTCERVVRGLKGLRRFFTGKMLDIYRAVRFPERDFEIIAAGIDFAAQMLASDHPFLDVREVGRDLMVQHRDICLALTGLVHLRFGPALGDVATWQAARERLQVEIADVGRPATITVLESILAFVSAIRATNVYRDDRLGQSFQLDPEVLPAEHFPQQPYGIFYFHGSQGVGFQIRFRASARGGLRLLVPRTNVQLTRSRDKLLREVYDLAWAQQLKNKDIPEGGAKCIALIRPEADVTDMVKMLTDSLLDLILPAALVPEVTGPHGEERAEELIFLGPDENMTPERIVWVAERAEFRGLPRHLTLMSSKPGAGINHKEYGVTSEGLYCWLPHVLRALAIPEGQPWTVKMTGGPDGDVGGNLIKILHREQRERCRVVAISDGSGSAYDPDGLDWDELLRLFRESTGIAGFARDRLRGQGAHVTPVTDRASEDLRNNLHNQVPADLFIPCGGRPYTINDRNWRDFLNLEGKPSALAMVEGANIFITSAARSELQKLGMISIKDSSANKGGVICSSYEILAGLVLSEAEFVANKERYVAETVAKLRLFAEQEADALLGAWRRRRGSVQLSELSMQMSAEINRISGLLESQIDVHLEDPELVANWRREIEGHCPPILVESFGDRLEREIPRAHRIALLAKRYASRMLYREGLTWCRNYLHAESVADVFAAYLAADDAVVRIGDTLRNAGMAAGEDVVAAVLDGARREIVRRKLGH